MILVQNGFIHAFYQKYWQFLQYILDALFWSSINCGISRNYLWVETLRLSLFYSILIPLKEEMQFYVSTYKSQESPYRFLSVVAAQ